MASKLTLSYLDFDSERSSFSVEGVDLTAANLVAQEALIASLVAATGLITEGTLNTETVVLRTETISSTPPTLGSAQREGKWLVTYVDDVTDETHQAEIPCPDFDLLVPGSGLLNTGVGTDGADFVAAFEAFVRGHGTNTVTVLNVRHVGRNL